MESYPAEQNPLGQRVYASVMILHLLFQLNVDFTQERGYAQHSHILAHVYWIMRLQVHIDAYIVKPQIEIVTDSTLRYNPRN